MTADLEAGDVLAEAAQLVVLRGDGLPLRRAPRAGGCPDGGGGDVVEAAGGGGAPTALQVAEGAAGGGPLGEAVVAAELAAAVLRQEEHLHHAARRQAVVLHGVRRRLRRQLARVDEPAQRPPLLLARARVCLQYARRAPSVVLQT
jgi:hypothetical protein